MIVLGIILLVLNMCALWFFAGRFLQSKKRKEEAIGYVISLSILTAQIFYVVVGLIRDVNK